MNTTSRMPKQGVGRSTACHPAIRRGWWTGATVLLMGAVLLLVSSCTTRPRIDWDSRVGSYTYDQAVIELGPPDRMTEIGEGRKVADWVTGRSSTPRFSIGVGSYGSGGGVGVGTGTGGNPYEKILRLTFDRNGDLERWENAQR